MATVRKLMVVEMKVEDAGNPEAEFEARLDAFREAVVPSREYGISLYAATDADLTAFVFRSDSTRISDPTTPLVTE